MRGRHDTNRLYGPRREVPYARPAGRQANATQEAFARARSVWPRRNPTTGPDRGRTSLAEVARGCPKPTCAGPPGRARACRVLCGPLGSRSLPVPSPCSIPTLLFTTLLDARSLRRLRARHSLSFSLSSSLPSSLFNPLPSLRSCRLLARSGLRR